MCKQTLTSFDVRQALYAMGLPEDMLDEGECQQVLAEVDFDGHNPPSAEQQLRAAIESLFDERVQEAYDEEA